MYMSYKEPPIDRSFVTCSPLKLGLSLLVHFGRLSLVPIGRRSLVHSRAAFDNISGESFTYLGRHYRLRVSEGERESVKLSRGYLDVITPSRRDANHIRAQVEAWLHKQARRVFYERTHALLPRFAPLTLPEPELVIKPLKSRWGTCTHDGKITLNLALIRMPKANIDYVIVHELCHLIEHNHGKEFYELLGRVMPDWQARRQRLNEREILRTQY